MYKEGQFERASLLEKIDSDGVDGIAAGCMDLEVPSLESLQSYAMTFYEDDDDLALSRTNHVKVKLNASDFQRSIREKITLLEVLSEMYNFRELVPDILTRSSSKGSSRLAPLDGVRALAFLWVTSDHLESSLQTFGYTLTSGSTLYSIITHGELGVSMFFVLSGFLISFILFRMYQRSHTINYGTFIYTRFLRIWPAYNIYPPLSILLVFASKRFLFYDEMYYYTVLPCINGWWTNAVFLTDFSVCFDVDLCQGHLWTVSTEFQMYLVTPILTLAWLKNPPLGCSLIVMGMAGSLFFAYEEVHNAINWCTMSSGVFSGETLTNDWPMMRFPEYACGMLAAFCYITSQEPSSFLGADSLLERLKQRTTVRYIWHLGLVGSVAYLVSLMGKENDVFTYTERFYTMAAACLSLIMLTALDRKFSSAFSWFLSMDLWYPFASLSYTGYLASKSSCPFATYIIMYFGISEELTSMSWICVFMVNTSICLVMAFLLSSLVERPFMRLRSIIVKKDVIFYRGYKVEHDQIRV